MVSSGSISILASVGEVLTTPANRAGTVFDTISKKYAFTNGTINGTNDLVWSARRTVALGATDTIDLNGGGLLDAFGNAVNFLEVTGIIIANRETVAGTRTLRFGPNLPANAFLWLFVTTADLTTIVPGGGYAQWSDVGVSCAGGADTIRIINTDGANAVVYDILIVGRSV